MTNDLGYKNSYEPLTYPNEEASLKSKAAVSDQAMSEMDKPADTLICKELRVMDERLTELTRVITFLGDRLMFVSSNRPSTNTINPTESTESTESTEPSEVSPMARYLHEYNKKIKFSLKQINLYMTHLDI